jgi:cysteine synthase
MADTVVASSLEGRRTVSGMAASTSSAGVLDTGVDLAEATAGLVAVAMAAVELTKPLRIC